MSIQTVVRDLEIRTGRRFVQPFDVLQNGLLVPFPVGTTAAMQIRDAEEDGELLEDLTMGNGKILIDLPMARVTVNLLSAVTAGFTWKRGWYDLKLTYSSGESDPLAEGKVFVKPSITI